MSQNTLLLPPQSNGTRLSIDNAAKQVVIVGANGAGKSRFTSCMIAEYGEKAFPLSALAAIFGKSNGKTGNETIDRLYAEAVEAGMPHSADTSQFDRVLALLMQDEMLNLIGYKLHLRTNPDARLRATRLDSVIDLWQQVFPGSRVLIESGRLLFAREAGSDAVDAYSPTRLSAGEKAVLYYLAAMSYAPKRATVFVDSPEMFLHPTITQSLWNHIEIMRPDCRFVYTTHDLDFAASRTASTAVWVRDYDPASATWVYETLPPNTAISDDIYRSILGSRKPVLFIEGDGRRSIDSKLYPLIFSDFTVQALGSCNKVIEATRTFNDLNSFHHLDSSGIVDRDRRDSKEVEYLRGKRIMVPDVAEVENLLLLEEVVRAVATWLGKDEDRVAASVKRYIMKEFRHDLVQQALLHTRHRVKRIVECRIDGKFQSIEMLERHLANLPHEINPRGVFNNLVNEFQHYVAENDYASVLRVYNQKSMLPGCNVAQLCGLHDKDDYLYTILKILRRDGPESSRIRMAMMNCFHLSTK
ncbi:MAG: DUF4435 domain-containing protein [Firmicutes bacterium]|nr:DUF4435 domain-containing protein [Bacillota bacterium]MCM1400887.1 DUF4435 domain-containing protein [Bacteroides sp.]MCM1476279.1 DUF4435 domain-containing protein [Bacteroides sp.]